MNTKPKIKTTKLTQNPLFIKFLNWKGDKYSIEELVENMVNKFEDASSKQIITEKLNKIDDSFLNNLSDFQTRFKKFMVESILTQTVSEVFIYFLNNSYKYIEEDFQKYLNDEVRKIRIKDENGRWFEAVVCYNFIMAFNYFGLEIIKLCPICGSFFSHKGKYAKYCSDGCKAKGMKK